MSNIPSVRAHFLKALIRIAEGTDCPEDLTDQFRATLLAFASETPDNVSCTSRVKVGELDKEIALKFQDHPVLLSEIAHLLEDEPMPDGMKTAFPNLTEADWEAFTRLTTLLYVLLARTSKTDSI